MEWILRRASSEVLIRSDEKHEVSVDKEKSSRSVLVYSARLLIKHYQVVGGLPWMGASTFTFSHPEL